MRRLTILAMALGLAAGLAACATGPGEPTFAPGGVRGHVRFLADDALAGREPGTPGYDLAALYVATEFESLGLTPAGDDGTFLQTVPLRAYDRSIETDRIDFYTTGRRRPRLTPLEDYIVGASADRTSADLRAPVVYVGYGVVDETYGRDDYADVDVDGKIVAVLQGVPDGFPSEVGAYHRSGRRKIEVADAHGAVGVLWLPTPASVARVPWERHVVAAQRSSMTWTDADGVSSRAYEHVASTVELSESGAAKLFEDAPMSYAEIFAALESGAPTPAPFALPTGAEIRATSRHRDIVSSNVVGVLEGSDPVLKNEYVVLSAHLDHLGTQLNPGTDDKIYNGAMDNAAGVSAMLEVARAFAEEGRRPKRSLLFLAVTAEEKGLVGSDFYATFPTRPIEAIVADVNLDMPLLLYDFTDVIAFGAERSTLGEIAAAALAPMDVALSPDPMPDQAVFVRSDHFNFVRRGVPAVFLATGYANGGEEAWARFFADRYHQPGDDLGQGVDWDAGAKFAEANYRIVEAVANAPERPVWRAGDYFGLLFNGPMENDPFT